MKISLIMIIMTITIFNNNPALEVSGKLYYITANICLYYHIYYFISYD